MKNSTLIMGNIRKTKYLSFILFGAITLVLLVFVFKYYKGNTLRGSCPRGTMSVYIDKGVLPSSNVIYMSEECL